MQGVASREREILESTVEAIEERARHASTVVEEARASGHGPSDEPLAATRLRMGLSQMKGELERKLAGWLLHSRRCNRSVHWMSEVGAEPGRRLHTEPAPEHDPDLSHV